MGRDMILLRTDGNEVTGMGHFMRCLTLGGMMGRYELEPHFVLQYRVASMLRILEEKGFGYTLVPEDAGWEDEAALLEDDLKRASGLLLDISHRLTAKRLKGFDGYTRSLRKHCPVIGLIDGLKYGALIEQATPDVDLVITPYYGVKNVSPLGEKGFFHLAGCEYMVFQEEYAAAAVGDRDISRAGARVLVTFGGSDPQGLTLRALEWLSLVKRDLEVRVVVGPGFETALAEKVRQSAKGGRFNCEVIESPEVLVDLMLWCDLAISSTGLTKYELALTGTPALFLSIDKEHAEIHKAFEPVGTGRDLGLYSRVNAETVAGEIEELLDDYRRRQEMSRNGREVVDCLGGERILGRLRQCLQRSCVPPKLEC